MRDVQRDALALVQARYDGDDQGLTVILDACNQRFVAATLADIISGLLHSGILGDPAAAMAEMRRICEEGF